MRLIQNKTDIVDAGMGKEMPYQRLIVYACADSRMRAKFCHWMKTHGVLATRYDTNGIPLPCQENAIIGIGKDALTEQASNNVKADDMVIPSENAYDIWIPLHFLRELLDIEENGMLTKGIMRKVIISIEFPTSQKVPFGMGKLGFAPPRELTDAEKNESRKYAKPGLTSGSTLIKDCESLPNGGRNVLRRIRMEWKSNTGYRKGTKVKQSQFLIIASIINRQWFDCANGAGI